MEGQKNLLNRSPSILFRAPVPQPSPQQLKSTQRALRLMRITCKFPQFDSWTIITVTEMDYSRPCFEKTISMEPGTRGVEKSGKCTYWRLRCTWLQIPPNSTQSRIQLPNTTPRQWPWPEITSCPSRQPSLHERSDRRRSTKMRVQQYGGNWVVRSVLSMCEQFG